MVQKRRGKPHPAINEIEHQPWGTIRVEREFGGRIRRRESIERGRHGKRVENEEIRQVKSQLDDGEERRTGAALNAFFVGPARTRHPTLPGDEAQKQT